MFNNTIHNTNPNRNIPNIILIVTLAKHTMIPVHLDTDKDNPIS